MGECRVIYDVVVVGAGPAGSSAALSLEKQGINILLVDKEAFPRNKVCAGVLPPRIFSELEIPEDVIERPLAGYRVFSPSGYMVESAFSNPGAIVNREQFDYFLVNRLKSRPKHVRVTDCVQGEDFITVIGDDFSAKAKIVIGCDGVSSRVKKECFVNDSDMIRKGDMALGGQYEVSLPTKEIDENFGNWFEVFYTIPYGYFWVTPLRNEVKVGCGGTSDEFKNNSRAVLEEFMRSEGIKKRLANGDTARFESHLIPMRGPHEVLASDRALVAGDAGGFVFPGTGEGVFYAVKSGRIAAEVAGAALEEGRFDSQFLEEMYSKNLEKNGLLSLRDVDFVDRVLASPEKAEQYIKKLKVFKTQ